MSRLLHRPNRDEGVLLVACTTSRTAPAPHLSRRRDRDRPVGFADVAAIPDPEWSRSGHNASRYSVDGLVPGGQAALAAVPLTQRPVPGRDCIVYLTAVSTAIHADHERHLDTLRVIDDITATAPDTHLLAMTLAPVLAQLEEPLPGTYWLDALAAVLPVRVAQLKGSVA